MAKTKQLSPEEILNQYDGLEFLNQVAVYEAIKNRLTEKKQYAAAQLNKLQASGIGENQSN